MTDVGVGKNGPSHWEMTTLHGRQTAKEMKRHGWEGVESIPSLGKKCWEEIVDTIPCLGRYEKNTHTINSLRPRDQLPTRASVFSCSYFTTYPQFFSHLATLLQFPFKVSAPAGSTWGHPSHRPSPCRINKQNGPTNDSSQRKVPEQSWW